MENPYLDNRILWVGPGLDSPMRHWIKALYLLRTNKADPLHISDLKMLDVAGTPKLLYGKRLADMLGIAQEAECGDFFSEEDTWDIIILDYIEAWKFGGYDHWPNLSRAPYSAILREWELKLKQLNPYQVWVRHDGDIHSTIIPMLKPHYKLVVDVQSTIISTYPKCQSEKDVLVGNASFWTDEAATQFKDLHVWQLADF